MDSADLAVVAAEPRPRLVEPRPRLAEQRQEAVVAVVAVVVNTCD